MVAPSRGRDNRLSLRGALSGCREEEASTPDVAPAKEPVKKSSQFPANCDSMEMWQRRFLMDHRDGGTRQGSGCGCEPCATVLGPDQSGGLVGARPPRAIVGRFRRDA